MNTLITVDGIDFSIYYTLKNGEPAITHLAPEDCDEGTTAEIEITEIYLADVTPELGALLPDLSQVLKESVITEIENKILEDR